MDLLAPFRRLGAIVRRCLGHTESRLVLPIFLIALLGPLGESVDVALFSELEMELLASDLGLEIVSSALVYGYHLVLVLLGLIAVSIAMALSRDGAVSAVAPVSCRSRLPVKIPIG
jgi:hypothetical protein